MLSDEQMDREIREHVEKHPVILPEDYQTMVQNQIKKCCEGEMSMSQNKQRKKKMIAAACMILCIGVCGAGGVRAGMNYAKQRAEQTSEKEQEALWTDAAKADADTFSRELSQKEQKRLNELAEKYQTEGLFPDGSILQISDKSEIVSDQICFLAQNSTFYLPEKALNDEQMLELIDFYAKRDYSVTAQGQKDAEVTKASVKASVDDVTEITQEEALEKAAQEETERKQQQEEVAAAEQEKQKQEEAAAIELENQQKANDQQNAIDLENQGNMLFAQGKYESAITFYQTAQVIYRRLELDELADNLNPKIDAARAGMNAAAQGAATT